MGATEKYTVCPTSGLTVSTSKPASGNDSQEIIIAGIRNSINKIFFIGVKYCLQSKKSNNMPSSLDYRRE